MHFELELPGLCGDSAQRFRRHGIARRWREEGDFTVVDQNGNGLERSALFSCVIDPRTIQPIHIRRIDLRQRREASSSRIVPDKWPIARSWRHL